MKETSQSDQAFRDAIVSLMPTLLQLNQHTELNDLYYDAVRIGLEKLNLERCGISPLTENKMTGSWGTNMEGGIVDESHLPRCHNPIIQQRIDQGIDDYYFLLEDTEHCALVDGEYQIVGRGWVVCTPVLNSEGEQIALFFNDTARTHTPINHEQQILVALFCAHLGWISDRITAQSALIDSTSRLRQLESASQEIFWTTNKDGSEIYYLSPAFESIWGYTPEQAYQDPSIWLSAILPEYRERTARQFAMEAHRGNFDEIYPIKRADGEIRWLRDRGLPSYDTGGEVIRISGVTTDITEQVEMEEKFRKTKSLYQNLVSQLPAITYVIEIHGTLDNIDSYKTVFISPQVEQFFGFSQHEWQADDGLWLHIVHPDHRDDVVTELLEAGSKKKNIRLEYRALTRDGQERWIHNQAIIADEPAVSGAIQIQGCMFDITREKEAIQQQHDLQRKLLKAERMESIGLLAGSVAHDLNNILGPVVGYPDLLLDEMEDSPPRVQRDLEAIRDSARKAADVIQDLLNLARRENYELVVLDLNQQTRQFLESPTFESMILSHPRTRIRMDIPKTPLYIEASIPHLSKLLMNLIINGSEAMDGGGQITISTKTERITETRGNIEPIEPGEYACIYVQDEGSGIDQAHLHRIFEPFFTTKSLGRSGTGLGLSVVHGVVKDFFGYIDVDSQRNQGTVFKIYIPISHKRPETEEQNEDIPTRGGHVLIIDDIAEQRVLAERLLTRLGYTSDSSIHGHDAVEYFKQGKRADILMLDMIMEDDFDGLDTYREILKIVPNQKCLIVSGFSATERVEKAIDLGAGMYISKPYSLQKLDLAIRRVLHEENLVS